MQLVMSIDRWLPKYRFQTMFSVPAITIRVLGWVARMSRAASSAMMLPAHPMPERLKVRTSLRILKWWTTAALGREGGVGCVGDVAAARCSHPLLSSFPT
jgi:hypothetical protein